MGVRRFLRNEKTPTKKRGREIYLVPEPEMRFEVK
jgi:hypothetical protein